MNISQTQYYKLFEHTLSNILKIHDIVAESKNYREHEYFFCCRALCILKLDKLLFDYKQNYDHLRMLLVGKSALTSYLINNKGMSLSDSKSISLNDALIVLWEDIKKTDIPLEVMAYLTSPGCGFNFADYKPRFYMDNYPEYLEAEWDPVFWDEYFLK